MNKVLVKLYVPILEEIYDVWLPSQQKIYNVICLLVKAINELNDEIYGLVDMPMLYDKFTAEPFDLDLTIKDSTIRSGAELILI